MITRIEIEAGDRLTITCSSVNFHGIHPHLGVTNKWTVTSHSAAFENMFLQLCAEATGLTALADIPDGGEKTVFTITDENGKKQSYELRQPEERYRTCFTLIDQMMGEAHPIGKQSKTTSEFPEKVDNQ